MALNLGELFGTIGLDSSNFDKGLANAQGNLKNFGVAGAAIALAAAAAVGAALGKGIADNMDIEVANKKLKASLGLNDEQAATAGKVTGALYAKNFGESMDDVRTGVSAVMSSIKGMKTASQADVEDMTARMLTLADTMGVDVSRAAQVAGQMITTGMAKDGTQAADLLTKAMQSVPENVREDILDATDEYGPFFSNLGISGEKAMGMLVKSSEQGMYGIDKTGDALKEFGIRSTDMSKASGAAYEAIGLSQKDMTNDLLAGGDQAGDAFQKIIKGVQGIKDPADQSAAAIALFGTPLEDLSVTEIPKFLGTLSDAGGGLEGVAGSSDKAMKDLSGSAKSGFSSFKRQAETALIDVVNVGIMPAVSNMANFLTNTVGPAITDIGAWITDTALPALNDFGDWFAENQGAIGTWAGVITLLLLPIFVRLAIQAGLTATAHVVAFATMSGAAIKHAAVWVAQSYVMVGRFIAVSAQMVAMAVKYVAQWVIMSAGAAANGVKIAAVWTAQVIATAARGVASMVVTAARYVAQWVIMAVQSGLQALRMAAAWVVGVGIPAVAGAITMGIQAALVVGAWILMGAQAMAQAVRMAAAWFIALGPIGWIIAAIIGLVALVILNWDKVSTFTAQAWANIVSFITGAWENIKTGVSDGINSVIEWFTGMPDRILGALGNLGNLLLDAGKQILDGFLNGLTDGFNAVKDFVGGIGTWIADHKGPKRYDLGLLVPAGGWIMDGLNTGLKDSMPALGSQLSDVSWMIQNGIDPELAAGGNYAFTGSGATDIPGVGAAGNSGASFQVTIEGQEDPEATWQIFKSRANESLRAQGSDVLL
ncbi:phage tail tape measure protein [Glutamicibacter ardleyensis]|uniref:phage tail tape measure protein n=1 Tax=Glutamicibacter ardleyensis TaxID=225894 RepID=UPI003FD223DD